MLNDLAEATRRWTEKKKLFLIGLGVAVTVENPLNSLFWLTSFMLKLFDKEPGTILESLGILSDGQHQHDSWKPRWVNGKLFFRQSKKPLTLQFCANGLRQFV